MSRGPSPPTSHWGKLTLLIGLLTTGCTLDPDAPLPETAAPVVQSFSYACPDGFSFVAQVSREVVHLSLPGRSEEIALAPMLSGSGARYGNGTTIYWSKGREAQLEADGVIHVSCRYAS